MEHVPKDCMVKGCDEEASYWVDTAVGFVESLMETDTPSTFYLCAPHQAEMRNELTGNYHHLRIDTGELFELVFGGYACHPDCETCHDWA